MVEVGSWMLLLWVCRLGIFFGGMLLLWVCQFHHCNCFKGYRRDRVYVSLLGIGHSRMH